MKRSWKRLISVILSAAMLLAMAVTGFAAPSSGSGRLKVTWEKVDGVGSLRQRGELTELPAQKPIYADKDVVRVSIVLNDESTLDKMGRATKNIGLSASAMQYRESLRSRQDAVAAEISEKVLGGAQLDVVWNLTLAANIISANVEFGKIEAIKALDSIKDVFVEMQYLPDVATKNAYDPNMSTATEMTGGSYAWAAGYTGAGSKVAVVDTGLDTDHQSFDSAAFEYAIDGLDKDVDLLSEDEVASVWGQLNAAKFIGSADGVYLSAKVPFAVNYVDKDLDVTHDNDGQGEHGSHVAGIAAANRYIANGDGFEDALTSVLTQGEAPDAQLIVMKVFGKGGGAYDSDYMAAIEDAIVLGCDAVNLSLGSSVAGFTTNAMYQDILNGLADSNIVWANSAGNNYSWANDAFPIGYLYGEDKSFATGGSPGTYQNTLSVASVDNKGYTGEMLVVDGNNIIFNENTDYGNAPISSIAGDQTYILIDGVGTDEEFAAIADVLEGNVAVCSRGSTSFYQKANAAAANGAAAVIIYNNQAGTIGLNLTGYEYHIPVVSITQADGAVMKAAAEEKTTDGGAVYYEGTVTVNNSASVENPGEVDYYTMSDFSSWGVPGDLSMKPEITAPGGNIYSVNGAVAGGTSYENMSGTSMASPQIAGITAVAAQYIRENDLTSKTGLTQRQLIQSLLMSTATPLIEEESGSYYSVLKQGAGLVNVEAAINSRTFITMDESATESAADGKVKAELGADADRGGEYTVKFTVTNFSDEDVTYELSADFFTQDYFMSYAYNTAGRAVAYAYYADTMTAPLEAELEWTVNGRSIDALADYDFNGDGKFTTEDVQTLLDFVVGTVDSITNEEYADLDGDGDIDTYDVYLLRTEIVVPAGESADIELNVTLTDIDDYDLNGAYIEGYIFVDELASEDGAEGVSHSIPVLGFYGSWSESSMFDVGSALEYEYGLEARAPYMTAALGANAANIETFISADLFTGASYMMGGNPFMTDVDGQGRPVYLEERNAVSGYAAIAGVRYSQIRNAAAARFALLDADGNLLYETVGAPANNGYAAYYYRNQAVWQYTYATATWGLPLYSFAEDGDVITVAYSLATEYDAKGGEVDWDSLGAGATLSYTGTVDSAAPDILDIAAETDEDGKYTVTLTAQDNMYIAAVAVMDEANYNAVVLGETGEPDYVGILGSDIEAEAGAEYIGDIEYAAEDWENPNQLYIEVYDYAANYTAYKVNFEKDDQYADEESYELTLVSDELLLVGGGSADIQWLIDPWGVEQEEGFEITFVSDDETIATVDDYGTVTAVTREDGECNVTVTASYGNYTASAVCHIIVKYIDKELYGVVWDEEGQVWFSEFNLKSLPEYTRLNSENAKNEIASIAIDPLTGTMFAASFDSDNWLSSLYTVDPDNDYALELIGGSDEIGYMDIAAAPGTSMDCGSLVLAAVYGPYVVIVDASTGDYLGVFDLSSSTGGAYLVGIAYETSGYYEDEEDPSIAYYYDWYFLVDENGTVYEMGMLGMDGSFYNTNVYNDGPLGYTTDTPYFNSLYLSYEGVGVDENGEEYDIENLYWSCFSYDESRSDIIMVEDLYGAGNIYKAGSFADDVWPIGGLYEPLDSEEPADDTVKGHAAQIRIAGAASTERIESLAPAKAGGAINAAPVTGSVARPETFSDTSELADGTVKVVLTSRDETTNGLLTFEYDSAVLEFVSLESDAEFSSYLAEDGKITFGYVDSEGIAADAASATITFNVIDEEAEKTEVAITTLDSNDENPANHVEYMNIDLETEAPAPTPSEPDEPTPSEPDEPTPSEPDEPTPSEPDEPAPSEPDEPTPSEPTPSEPTPTEPEKDEWPFIDVTEDDWFFEEVKGAYYAGLMDGTSSNTFSPLDNSSRAQIATVLWRLAGKPEPKAESKFEDVDENAYYAKAIAWANEAGVVLGTSETTAEPDRDVTRQELATMVYRYVQLQGKGFTGAWMFLLDFEDAADVADWADEAVHWCVMNKILNGKDGNKLDPWGTATRAEVAAVFNRLNEIL